MNGEPIYHYSGLSVFAQYAVVSQNALIKIPDDVPLEDATIFGCAVVTGVGAVLNTAQVPPGGQMAVVGLGGVGMNALMGGVVAGAERIVAVDLNADKLKLARELGATDTFLAGNADVVEEIRNATEWRAGLRDRNGRVDSGDEPGLCDRRARRHDRQRRPAGLDGAVLLPARGAGQRRKIDPRVVYGQLCAQT